MTDHTRRGFLHSAGCVAGALAALRIFGDEAAAIPISVATGEQIGNERSYPIPAGDGVTVDHDAQVILARAQGKVFAFALACPHQNAAVKWLATDRRFQCTKHDSQYQPDGTYTSGRATRNLDRFPIRRQATTVLVDVTKVYQSDRDPAGWAAACVTL
jgi:Rieske Fe-S protein